MQAAIVWLFTVSGIIDRSHTITRCFLLHFMRVKPKTHPEFEFNDRKGSICVCVCIGLTTVADAAE